MTHRNPLPPDTQPNDLVGKGPDGKWRIDRVVPFQWLMGIIGGVLVLAAQQYYAQQQLIEKVSDMRTEYKATAAEIRAITSSLSSASTRDAEHSLLIQALQRDAQEKDRRIAALENRK